MNKYLYIIKPLLIICLFSAFFSTSFAGPGTPYDRIVFFGDSLSDNGNLYSSDLGFLPKSPQYYQGRFSNGLVWSEHFAKNYIEKSSLIGSVNYAFGGETVLLHNPFDGYLPYTLTDSYYSYLIRTTFSTRATTLFIIFIGANDYLHGLKKEEVDQTTTNIVNYIKATIEGFIYHGGNNFLIVNLPDISKTPLATEENKVENFHDIAVAHNTKLANAVAEISAQYNKVNIRLFEISELFDNALEHTDQFNQKHAMNITTKDRSCWEGGYTLASHDSPPLSEKAILDKLNTQLDKQKINASFTDQQRSFSLHREDFAKAILNTPALREAYLTQELAAQGNRACLNGDNYIFWDRIHPTRTIHKAIATEAIEFADKYFDHI